MMVVLRQFSRIGLDNQVESYPFLSNLPMRSTAFIFAWSIQPDEVGNSVSVLQVINLQLLVRIQRAKCCI